MVFEIIQKRNSPSSSKKNISFPPCFKLSVFPFRVWTRKGRRTVFFLCPFFVQTERAQPSHLFLMTGPPPFPQRPRPPSSYPVAKWNFEKFALLLHATKIGANPPSPCLHLLLRLLMPIYPKKEKRWRRREGKKVGPSPHVTVGRASPSPPNPIKGAPPPTEGGRERGRQRHLENSKDNY